MSRTSDGAGNASLGRRGRSVDRRTFLSLVASGLAAESGRRYFDMGLAWQRSATRGEIARAVYAPENFEFDARDAAIEAAISKMFNEATVLPPRSFTR
jgi:hypothetical protein